MLIFLALIQLIWDTGITTNKRIILLSITELNTCLISNFIGQIQKYIYTYTLQLLFNKSRGISVGTKRPNKLLICLTWVCFVSVVVHIRNFSFPVQTLRPFLSNVIFLCWSSGQFKLWNSATCHAAKTATLGLFLKKTKLSIFDFLLSFQLS